MEHGFIPDNEVEAMALHEEAIAHLYESFAEAFPEHGEFWLKLASEEHSHADWVRRFKVNIEEGKVSLNESRFNIPAIETSVAYINGYAVQARNRQLNIRHAASIALDIENALLDRKFLEIYETDDEELVKVLNGLSEATKAHQGRVREFLDNLDDSVEDAIG